MIGYKLTNQQADDLINQWFAPDQYFNPVMDINNVYFIFDEEVLNCINPNFLWVKDLPQAEYILP